jgi:DNA helicase-2/ATP-dependent DNA helicase PcrA
LRFRSSATEAAEGDVPGAANSIGMKTEALDFAGIAAYFSGIKTGRRGWKPSDRELKPLYREYLKGLKLSNAVDFDDLILLPIALFTSHPDTRK